MQSNPNRIKILKSGCCLFDPLFWIYDGKKVRNKDNKKSFGMSKNSKDKTLRNHRIGF